MCGRFALIEPIDIIAQKLGVTIVEVTNTAPRYNIAPGEDVVALVFDNTLKLREYRWGLIPHWVRDITTVKPLINARSETVTQKSSFKKAFAYNRCVIVASGFYEWKKDGNKKTPYFITFDEMYGFAGIYDTVIYNGKTLSTCAILTTNANEQMKQIHSRMPVLIPSSQFSLWAHPDTAEYDLYSLMQPRNIPLHIYPVTPKVNNPRYKEPDCIQPHLNHS